MSRHKLSDAQLRKAAAQVRNSMLAQLPEDDREPVQLNRDFCLQMEKKEKRLRVLRQLRQQAMAAVLALVVGFGCLLTFNAEVRAAVVSWFKEMYDTYVVYHFPGERPEVLPDLEFTWLPEGIELVELYDEVNHSRSAIYMDIENPEYGFVIDWSMRGTSDWNVYLDEGGDDFESVCINGYDGEIVLPREEGENITLIWFDTDHDIMFLINGNLDPDVILHIAEGVVLTEVTK